MLTSGFADSILMQPMEQENDTLYILTAYATPEMASWTIKALADRAQHPLNIVLLIGMAAEGISERAHNAFVRLHELQYGSIHFECSYIDQIPFCHMNFYLWKRGDVSTSAFMGSADFTQSSILFPVAKELMNECNPLEAWLCIKDELGRSIYCNHNEVHESIRILNKHPRFDIDVQPNASNRVTISLLTNKGTVAERSGLNWGQRRGRNPNQAYIRLPSKISQTGFFPLDRQFSVMTDDGKAMNLRVEQSGNKAITTPDSNALIGEYFRNRLGLANGEFITVDHLNSYGRTNVSFVRIDEETYYMDFSQPLR